MHDEVVYGRSKLLCWVAAEKYSEGLNDWGGRGYDDFIPGEVTKTAPSGDRTI